MGPKGDEFDLLAERAEADPEVAESLAFAYAALDADERAALFATARHRPALLALWLAVEEDPDLAVELRRALASQAPDGSARIWGDTHEGGALLFWEWVKPLGKSATLALRWSEHALEAQVLDASTVEEAERAVEVPGGARAATAAHGVHHAIEPLWRARRRDGALPSTLLPFADLLAAR